MCMCAKKKRKKKNPKQIISSSLGPVSGPVCVTEARETKKALASQRMEAGEKRVLFLMGGKLIVFNKAK